ncbi:hypothetical protein SOASR030_13660 [Leminorella grimontii]|uniref:Zinc resistance-associated protein n=1 Tax=Leminorella grimontii TaxID=82981 RepID=A0AAV5N0S4_9GAMM|nr:periplasmic heavy metal sensor [Leminorella grimontii]KFC97388.1 zinc resistance-associated protein [Leminorella grimontii ATCC 33999 = DSM 5078]GKX55254.1 hypothetical protein SOASR030_13660 [Leminorella grimontii]VFS56711.1 Zinc resistance-associated protein precursor [Leminorella grimontii]
MKLKKTAIAALLSLTAIGFGVTAAPHDHAAMGLGQPAQTEAPAPSSDAQPMPGGHGMHGQQGGMMCGGKGMMGGHQGMMANLTPEQQALLKKAHDDFRTATAPLRQKLTSKGYEYKAALTAVPLDEQKLLAVSKEISAVRAEIEQQRVNMDILLAKAGIPMMEHGMPGGMGMGGMGMGMHGDMGKKGCCR